MAHGTKIADRYELRSPIGHGAMGEVWEATDLRLNRPVAVKFIRPDLLADEGERYLAVRRFRREAAALAGVDHPNVASVHDASERGGLHFIVMQLVHGMATLADLVEERDGLAVDEAVAAAAQIAAGLSAAHAARLVHRDLKPQNVMVCPDGTIKVIDFGLVAVLEPGLTRLTSAGEEIGAPDYRAPEQAGGPAAAVDHRADLYALGCLLHFMLTAEPPFTAPSPALVLHAHQTLAATGPATLRGDIPHELNDLVVHLLAKRPDDRPAHAAEVYARLSRHLPAPSAGEAVTAWDTRIDVTRPFRFPGSPAVPS